MNELVILNELVNAHHVTIKMNSIGCMWVSTLSFEDEIMVHHFASKDLKDLFSGMVEEIEKKYKE